MRKLALVVVMMFGAGCTDPPVEPGTPTVTVREWWTQGIRTTVELRWPNATECHFDDWSCVPPDVSMTVLDVACEGCEIIEAPVRSSEDDVTVTLVSVATAERATITATLRFDATGARRVVSESFDTDRETEIDAQCGLVETSVLDQSTPMSTVSGSNFRACDRPPLASETVVVFPRILTQRGRVSFPFCDEQRIRCDSNVEFPRMRPIAELQTTPPITTWLYSDRYPSAFAVMPALDAGQTVELQARLATRELVTTTLVIPPAP